ncbi:MAG: S-layer homology domain-containing protein [Syntrophomonadaceae bacterium]|nr:S-layer homology domain-containing protein [Syntrophomonadaceae bacterium]
MKTKRFLSLLLAAALVFTLLPATVPAEETPPAQDGGESPVLSIGVSGATESGATAAFTGSTDGTVYYTVLPSDQTAPEETELLAGETATVTAGSALAVTLGGLAAQTDYSVYGLLEDAAGNRSAVAFAAFATGAEPAAPPGEALAVTALGAGYPDSFTVDVSEGNITISDAGSDELTITYGTPDTTTDAFPNTQEITITGSTTANTVTVASGVTANITLSGVDIDLPSNGGCAFALEGTAEVTLTLTGSNSLTSGTGHAGLQVPENAVLAIGGTGSLTAGSSYDSYAGTQGAGIGGGDGGDGGTISVSGGEVTAAGTYGAGIGGGNDGGGGSVVITGGEVTATGAYGAGIGGGSDGDGGSVVITGGSVEGISSNGAGIGGGGGSGGGSVEITGGSVNASGYVSIQGTPTNGTVNVYLTTLTLRAPSNSLLADTAISETDIGFGGTAAGYGKEDLMTDGAGKLYFYLPAGGASAAYGGNSYTATVETAHTNVFTLAKIFTSATVGNVSGSASQAVTLTANVTDYFSSPLNEGQVRFTINGTIAGTADVASGTAAPNWTIPSDWSAGNYTITAEYLGTDNFLDSSGTGLLMVTVNEAPAVTTGAVSGVTSSGAALSGDVTDDGGADVTGRGFVYGTAANPAIDGAGVTKVQSGSGTGSFNTAISGLAADTVYHVRAYAVNSAGTSYGADVTFTTQAGGGSSDGGSSADNGSSGGTPATVQPDKKPDQPVIAGFSITPTVDGNGHAIAAISEKSVADAIAKALADAKAQGKTANGIGVAIDIDLPDTANSLSVTLSQAGLKSLIDAGVKQLTINGQLMSLSLDLEALKEIHKQSTGDVTITIKSAQDLSAAAKKLIGTRPVYDVTVSYVKDGKTVNITSLGRGGATLDIPYTPGTNEAIGWLFGVYVDGAGQANRIPGSAYDANSRSVVLGSNHFSAYGIGYTAPAEKYPDIANHWARESIDYAVGRGLFSGTTATTFSPDTATDRGMLVTVLGRLAGADVSAYQTSSFTDVAAGKFYLPYVEWAYKQGIVSGIGNGKFDPEGSVTREEIALILQNYAKTTGYTLPVTRAAITFADHSSIGSTYASAVKAMQQAGIMTGGSGNQFNPKAGATRAEVSAMLHHYIKLTIDPATAQGWSLNDAGQWLCYKDGAAVTGWQTIDGVKYSFYSTGVLQDGWVQDGGNWRFYSGNKPLTGWWSIGGGDAKKTYYFDPYGNMTAGKWLQIDGQWYYFNADGALARSVRIDGYEVDEHGVRKSK